MFESSSSWDVDTAAEILNKSLFNTKKKRKKNHEKVTETHSEPLKVLSYGLPDSDDETFTKKQKKKLKAKRKKKDGTESDLKTEGDDSKSVVSNANNSLDRGEKTAKKKRKKTENQVEEPEGKAKKSKRKERGPQNLATGSDENPDDRKSKVKSKKRKRSLSEAESENPKPKIKRVDKNSNNEKSDQEKPTKKKRKRKKKNDPQKNKYRHLALNPRPIPDKSDLRDNKTVPTNKKTDKQGKSSDSENMSRTNLSLESISSKKEKKANDVTKRPAEKIPPGKLSSNDEGSAKTSNSPKKKKKKTSQAESETQGEAAISKHTAKENGLSVRNDVKTNPSKSKIVKQKEENSREEGLSEIFNRSNENRKPVGEQGSAAEKKKHDQKSSSRDVYTQFAEQFKKEEEKKNKVTSIWGKSGELVQQAKEKLNSARFRYVNEQLYTCSGAEALQLFRQDKVAFNVYHEGFEAQAAKWPVNPVDIITKQLKDKPKNLIIADFGCGDAKLAASIPHKVHSFDLVALNERVTACDMSRTPLEKESVDIAVFCLSLMGTNIKDYLHEANRVLKMGGLLKIAEVTSRFRGLSPFIDAVTSHGFKLLNKRDVNEMFYLLDFKKTKTGKKTATKEVTLKPCVYKRR